VNLDQSLKKVGWIKNTIIDNNFVININYLFDINFAPLFHEVMKIGFGSTRGLKNPLFAPLFPKVDFSKVELESLSSA
jgi:hypothetical protein